MILSGQREDKRRQTRGRWGLRRGSFWLSMMAILVLLAGTAAARAAAKSPQGKDVLRATLDNGLRVVIVRDPLSPVVSTVVNYLVGSNEAPEGFPGMAHAQEHMMFRGSPGLSADQLANITAAMGGMFDADTQQTVTQYYFTVPAEDLDLALHIEATRMSGLLDSELLWKEERGAIEQEVAQDFSNPDYVFYSKLLRAMFKGTPYAHDALGTRPSFQKTTGAMLKDFYDTWYAPSNAILVIAGDVDPADALAQVKQLFGGIKSKKVPKRPEVNLQPVQPATLKLDTDRSYGTVVVSFRFPGTESPDYAASVVLADVLSSQRGNLYGLVPAGKALSADFSMTSLPKAGLGYAEAAFPKGADTDALLKSVKEILLETVRGGVPSDLVEAAKRHEVADAEFEKNSVAGLAQLWSQALAVEGRHSPQDDVRAIQQVSVADVNRVARQYLDLDHAITAVLTPQPSGKPTSSQAFGGKESFAPTHVERVTLPPWAAKALARLRVPKSVVHPQVTILPNGLKLIVQSESVSKTVSVYGHVKNNADLEAPKGKDGVDEVLDRLFSFGTKSLDRLAFQKALDDIGANESAGTDFSVQVLADHFDRGVQLLADNELQPALPETAFKILQPQLAAAVAGRLQSPDYQMSRALSAALFPPGDPTLRQATPDTIRSLSIADVHEYYRHVVRPDLTTIVVIGDVSARDARAAIERHFGQWKAQGPKPNTVLPPVPANKSSSVVVPDSSRVQDRVILAETVGLTRSDPGYYPLELGDHVLGGAFYATRLYRDLREKSGLVYYVSSSFEIGKTRGLYLVNYACDPPNVSKARAVIERNLRQMRTTPVSAEELRQAQALLLRKIPLSESSVDEIARGLISRSIHDLPLDEPTLAARRYVKLTAKDVQNAFAKWVRLGTLVQVTQGPPPH